MDFRLASSATRATATPSACGVRAAGATGPRT